MPPKTIQVAFLRLEPVLDARLDELAGFFVRGFKRKVVNTKRQVGFLLSNIRLVAITPPEQTRSRVLLKFWPSGFTVQEALSSWRQKQGKKSSFLVDFEDWELLILEGTPQLDTTQHVFYSQGVEIRWVGRAIDILSAPQPAHFSALLDSKHHKIELRVQQLRKSSQYDY